MNSTHGIDVRHLRLLQALDEARTVSGAAARLGVTQPAVSHQLRELEARLATPVCVRTGRGTLLTPAGTRLLAAAQSVLAELSAAERDIVRLHAGGAGRLRLSAQCHTGYHWLPPLLRAFRAKHPGVDVELAVEHTSDPIAALVDGRLDLALLTGVVRDRRVRLRTLAADEHVAIVAAGHPFAARRFITPQELGAEDLLLYSPSAADSFTVRRILAPAGVRPARVRFVQLTEAILEMVKAGMGVTVMPRWAVSGPRTARRLRAVRITPAGIHRPWHAATLRAARPPAFVDDFIGMVERAIRGLRVG